MDIRNCISELLVLHDCVIIPGFGGFIGNYSPARIDPVHHSFVPPGKKLLFNINLKQNDGLLANCVAATFGLSYVDACSRIDEFADECRFTLKSGKSLFFPFVGRLTQGREGNLQFEQDKTVNLLPDAFGLTTFISPPVGRTSLTVKQEHPGQTAVSEPRRRNIPIQKAMKWAAIIAIPIGVAAIVGVTQFEKNRSSDVSNAGILSSVFSRFSSTSLVEKKEAPPVAPDTYYQQDAAPSIFDNSADDPIINESESITSNPETDLSQNQTAEPAAVNSTETLPESSLAASNSEDPFAIIVGAFRSKDNAIKYIADLQQKGTKAAIFDKSKGGLYRVTIGTFAIREEAEQLLSSAKSNDFSGAWLLAK